LVRDGLRSGPKTGHLGCVWYIEAAGFAAGFRQFADKSAPTKNARLWTSGASHDPNTPGQNQYSFCPEGVGADLSAMGCEAALKQA
ncbi:hypothetical protein ALQ84_01011, partial [Pseudomonas caricapapayae]